jgi:hypothetical protein
VRNRLPTASVLIFLVLNSACILAPIRAKPALCASDCGQVPANSESILFVGGGTNRWEGSDIGAQINAAYAALPPGGGTIVILPQPGGKCYNFRTEIAANVPGRYLNLRGAAPGAMSGAVDPTGLCLNWTVTDSSTPAVILDYAPQIGGGYANSHGISDITLTNSAKNVKNKDSADDSGATVCQKLGGCDSVAVGIQIGGVNSGAQSGEIANVRIMGFGTGITFKNNNDAISWGMIFRNDSIAYNNIGISVPTLENLSFMGGRIAVNGIGISLTGGADVYAVGLSIDSNSISGVGGASNSSFTCTNCHFENLTAREPITTHYYTGTQAATLVLSGGQALDDTPASVPPTDYWFSQSGASLYITGLQVYSAGRRAAQVVQANSPAVGLVSLVVDNPKVLNTVLAGSSGSVMNLSVGVNQTPPAVLFPSAVQSKSLVLTGSASGAATVSAPAYGGSTQVLPQGVGTIADIDQAQTWTASQTNMALVTPTIGSGSPINKVLLRTGTLKFTPISSGACQEQVLPAAGATVAGAVAASPAASLGSVNLSWQSWIREENKVTIRVCNVSQDIVIPNAVAWRVSIIQ